MTSTDRDTAADRPSAAHSPFSDLQEELANTRRALERFPDAHADWRPHEKSVTLAELAGHIANLPFLGQVVASSTEFDFATSPFVRPTARTRDELLELFDEKSAAAVAAIASLGPEAMRENWTLRNGDVVLASGSRSYSIRRLMLNHLIHHRAQLTVYYRLVGTPVPGLYGPSADEPM